MQQTKALSMNLRNLNQCNVPIHLCNKAGLEETVVLSKLRLIKIWQKLDLKSGKLFYFSKRKFKTKFQKLEFKQLELSHSLVK